MISPHSRRVQPHRAPASPVTEAHGSLGRLQESVVRVCFEGFEGEPGEPGEQEQVVERTANRDLKRVPLPRRQLGDYWHLTWRALSGCHVRWFNSGETF